jgi:hypothetical protein
MILIPLPIRKCLFACWFGATSAPSDLMYFQLNLTYILRFLPLLPRAKLPCTSNIPCIKSHIHFLSLTSFIQGIRPGPRLLLIFRNKLILYCEVLWAPRPTPKLEDRPLSAVHDCLFNMFAATIHMWRPSPPSATWGRAMPCWEGAHLT